MTVWRDIRLGFVIAIAMIAPSAVHAQDNRKSSSLPAEHWKTSPFHGVLDAATGKAIPCICRFRGEDYRLGATVCMQTHVGVVMARCDLLLNNTTWAPTDQPCTTSQRPLAVSPG